jgi:hypothetical protein
LGCGWVGGWVGQATEGGRVLVLGHGRPETYRCAPAPAPLPPPPRANACAHAPLRLSAPPSLSPFSPRPTAAILPLPPAE